MEEESTRKSLLELVCELGQADGVSSINRLPGCWERVVDESWTVWVNGHGQATPHKVGGFNVPAYSVYVEFNGLPAGVFDAYDGWLAAGEVANEEALVAALERAIAKAQGIEQPKLL